MRNQAMPINRNPYLKEDMDTFDWIRALAWARGSYRRYIHILKPIDPDNRYYREGWDSCRPNGELTK